MTLMDIRVCYQNPNPSGPCIIQFTSVEEVIVDAKTHDLIVYRVGDSLGTRISAGKWVWFDQIIDESAGTKDRTTDHARADIHSRTGTGTDLRRTNSTVRQSALSDLAYSTPQAIEETRAASVQFAFDNMTVPWSEAHMKALKQYEQEVERDYGPDAVSRLPWNNIPRADDTRDINTNGRRRV